MWAVLEQNRSETERSLRPLDKNPLRAPTIFRTLRSPLAPCSAPLTCSALDPLQFAYRPNRSTDDAISHILHSSLTHIDSSNGNYARLLFIDYSSAFNTIVPIKLTNKLTGLGLNTSLCDWIQNFLTGRPQVVKVGQYTSNSITLNVGAPQGCVLSPLLYSLYTHDCVSSHRSTSIIKFADDTVVLGLISNYDETAYLDEVERLTSWCQDNCLSLNVSKTKELIVDFRKRHLLPYTPLMISGTPVERVSSFKYLGVNISEDLTWTTHIQTQVKKARQRLYHLRQLRKLGLSNNPKNFLFRDHRKCIDSVHLSVVWKQLQPRLQGLAESCALRWAYLRVCSPLSAGHLPQTLQKQSCQNHQGLKSPWKLSIPVFPTGFCGTCGGRWRHILICIFMTSLHQVCVQTSFGTSDLF